MSQEGKSTVTRPIPYTADRSETLRAARSEAVGIATDQGFGIPAAPRRPGFNIFPCFVLPLSTTIGTTKEQKTPLRRKATKSICRVDAVMDVEGNGIAV